MRLVTYPNLCKACLEGLWLSLLRRVNLIDDVREECIWTPAPSPSTSGLWIRRLEIKLVPLAQFRLEPVSATETLTITWSKDGQVLESLSNKTRIDIDGRVSTGTFRVDVKFATDEVRKDPDRRLTSIGEYTITMRCGI
jgi:hypothetical protein